MEEPEKEERKADRQCWECLKRRLVCDYTLPHCRKCQKANKDCPGYDKKKPLQWIPNGMVTCRRGKKSSATKSYMVPPVPNDLVSDKVLDTLSHRYPPPIQRPYPAAKSRWFQRDDNDNVTDGLVYWPSNISTTVRGRSFRPTDDRCNTSIQEAVSKQAKTVCDEIPGLQMGGRARIEEIVAKRLYDEAAKLLRTEKQPMRRLEKILKFMQSEDLPNYNMLSNETSDAIQAIQYYNARMHPEAVAMAELAPNPAIVSFPLHALHLLPPTVHYTMVCLSLNHYIHSLPAGTNKQVAMSNKSKAYHYQGAAIRSLSHYIGQDKTRYKDATIASILMYMSVEVSSQLFIDWRSHARAMEHIIAMRGGPKSLLEQSPYLTSTLVIYALVTAMANTCSPPSDQIISSLHESPGEITADCTAFYSLMFPYTLCPSAMYTAVLRINAIRGKASASMRTCGKLNADHIPEADNLLKRIIAFLPEEWAQQDGFYEEWLLVGAMYHMAVALYCILSLQSLAILPNTAEMNTMRSQFGDRLLRTLRKSVEKSRIAKFSTWPLVVAGVESAYRGEGSRNWVEAALGDLSRSLGTSSMLKARAVLRRYWQRGKPGWDECFDCPETILSTYATC